MRSLLFLVWQNLLNTIFGKGAIEKTIRDTSFESLRHLYRPTTTPAGVTVLFPYRNPLVKEMVWALKYRKNLRVAKIFGEALATHLRENHLEAYTLTPIPLSATRFAERGFNQVALVLDTLPHTCHTATLLTRKHTKPQTTLSRDARIQNVHHIFEPSAATVLQNAHVILVDDVTTTGATLREAEKVLRAAGAASVRTVALAG